MEGFFFIFFFLTFTLKQKQKQKKKRKKLSKLPQRMWKLISQSSEFPELDC